MADKIVSPGVFTKENDLSFLQQGVADIGAAFIGPFKEGPLVPTIVNSQSEFETLFGSVDDTYYTPLAVQSYLREAGVATICRVAGVGGYTETAPLLISALNLGQIDTLTTSSAGLYYTSSTGTNAGTASIQFVGGTFTMAPTASVTIVGGVITAVNIIEKGSGLTVAPTSIYVSQSATATNYQTDIFDITYDVSGSTAAILFNTLTGSNAGFAGSTLADNDGNGDFYLGNGLNISASLKSTDVNDVEAVFGNSPLGSKAAYVHGYFKNSGINFDSHASCSVNILGDQNFRFDAQSAVTPTIKSQTISGQRYDLLKFVTIGAGNAANTKVKVGITNIKAAGSVAGTDYGTFTVVVRDFKDTNKKKIVLESFSNVNLDPNSPNYIARVIGDRSREIDSTTGKITEYGDWVNNSKYVRIWNSSDAGFVSSDSIPVQAVPFGHAAYQLPVSASAAISAKIPAATFVTSSATQYGGIDLDNNSDNSIYLKPIPTGASVGSNTVFGLDSAATNVVALSVGSTLAQFVVAFQEGFDGMSPATPIYKGTDIVQGNSQGFNLSTVAASGSKAYQTHIAALSNADEYDINMVVTPGVIRTLHPSVVTSVLDMVEARNDCFYIMDTTAAGDTVTTATSQAGNVDSNMAATYYPWIKTIDVNTNKLITVPPSVLLPGVFASNDRVAAEWFAPAGLNRGGLTGAVSVLNRLTQSEKDSLYEGKVNPIVQFPGQGIVVFGQKTLQDKPSALDRINVRRLLLTVRKYIASTSRYLVFEQNTAETRNRFLNIVNPYLESIQQRQGLYAFKVVMDETNNTPDVIDRNIMKGAIYLQPTRTAEFIQIDFNILPTGASFNG